jgi:hypothetical protein
MCQTAHPLARRLVTAGVVALVLSGCSGTSTQDAAGGAGDAARPAENAAGGTGAGMGGGDGASGPRTSSRVLPSDRDIVYRGQITVRVRDVARAAAHAEDLAVEVDGVVFSAQTSVDPHHRDRAEAHVTLRVPPTSFDQTLDSLGALGAELDRARSAQDVTTEVADVDSRVRTQERSVARLRALLGEADTVGEVVQVESELARREADLESLQAQLARLEDLTDLATVEATFVATGRPAPEEDDLGFLPGLRGGVDALVEVALVAATVLGAVLPFAVAAAVAGLPAYALLRSRRRTPAPEA